jgi:S-formylglutathione hydrolase FrmB
MGSAACQAEFACAAPVADRIEQITFASRSFGTDKHYCVVLPADYQRVRGDWPVLYILHGRGRSDRSLVDEPTTRDALLKAPFVTVLPNGEDGWYLDSNVNPKNMYTKLLRETIRDAERRYDLSPRPEKRAIAGWSMGGYGCVRYAEAHPNSFAVVAPILGLLDFPRGGLPQGQSYAVPEGVFGIVQSAWNELNPIHTAAKLRGADVLLITADRAFDRTMNENFRDRLRALDISHEWVVLEGEHTFNVVKEALPIVLGRVADCLDRTGDGKQNTAGVDTNGKF